MLRAPTPTSLWIRPPMNKLTYFFTILLAVLSVKGSAAATAAYGNDYTNTVPITYTASLTVTAAALGSVGANCALFVIVESNANFTVGSVHVDYNGVKLTQIGTGNVYSDTQTIYRKVWCLTGTFTGGTDIHVFSGGSIPVNHGGAAWHIRYFSYSGVGGVNTVSITGTNVTTSNSLAPVSTAFNFSNFGSQSTVLQMLPGQGSLCPNTYIPDNGTTRQDFDNSSLGPNSVSFAFSDYAPGASVTYSLSQKWIPGGCTHSSYGWGVEMAYTPATPTFTRTRTQTPTPSITRTQTPTRTVTSVSTVTSTSTPTPSITASPAGTLTDTPTITLTSTVTKTSTVTLTSSFSSTSTLTPSMTLTSTPTISPTPSASPTAACSTLGQLTPLSTPEGLWTLNVLKPVALSAPNRVAYIDVYVSSGTGLLQAAVYQRVFAGPNLVATSPVISASAGWNMIPINTATLPTGGYLLSVEGSNSLTIGGMKPGNDFNFNTQWGNFPSTIKLRSANRNYSIYAGVCSY